MFFRNHFVAHLMDSKTLCSFVIVCNDTIITNAIHALKIFWLTQICTSKSICKNNAFYKSNFKSFVKLMVRVMRLFHSGNIEKSFSNQSTRSYTLSFYVCATLMSVPTKLFKMPWLSLHTYPTVSFRDYVSLQTRSRLHETTDIMANISGKRAV